MCPCVFRSVRKETEACCATLFPPHHVAHSKTVRGVAIDALTMEVYSGSADCTVKVSGKGMGCGYQPLGM